MVGNDDVTDKPLQSRQKTATKTNGSDSELNTIAAAVAASKLGLADQLKSALSSPCSIVQRQDMEGRTCLHYACGYGHEECVDILLSHNADPLVKDNNGDIPLHFSAVHGHPHTAYNVVRACPKGCLLENSREQTPVDVAIACERGEVLNAMLLACAGDGGGVAVEAMEKLSAGGAVPDTWAPNGSSALMLAASVDSVPALTTLLEAGATIELQDALGRTALMFAAGNCAKNALQALLDAGALVSTRDRRGRSVLDYAPEGSDVRQLISDRLRTLEEKSRQLQADLLASLEEESCSSAGKGGGGAQPGKRKKKGKKVKKGQEVRKSNAVSQVEEDKAEAPEEKEATEHKIVDEVEVAEVCCKEDDDISALTTAVTVQEVTEEGVQWQVVHKGSRRPGRGAKEECVDPLPRSLRVPPRTTSTTSLCSSCSGESHSTDISISTAHSTAPSTTASTAHSDGSRVSQVPRPTRLTLGQFIKKDALSAGSNQGTSRQAASSSVPHDEHRKVLPAEDAHKTHHQALDPPSCATPLPPSCTPSSHHHHHPHPPPAQTAVPTGCPKPQHHMPPPATPPPSTLPCDAPSGMKSWADTVAGVCVAHASERCARPAGNKLCSSPLLPSSSDGPQVHSRPPSSAAGEGQEDYRSRAVMAEGKVASLELELCWLKSEVERLSLLLRQEQQSHQQEIVSILQDAAAHELQAVAEAVIRDRAQTRQSIALLLCAHGLLAEEVGGGGPWSHQSRSIAADAAGLVAPAVGGLSCSAPLGLCNQSEPMIGVTKFSSTASSVPVSRPFSLFDGDNSWLAEFKNNRNCFLMPASDDGLTSGATSDDGCQDAPPLDMLLPSEICDELRRSPTSTSTPTAFHLRCS